MDQEQDRKTPLIGPLNGATSTENLENASPAQLAETLEQMLDSMSEEAYDPELIDAYLDTLEKKAPMPVRPDAKAAKANFRRRLGALSSGPAAEVAAPAPPARRRRYRLPATVAATLALLFALMMGAQAVGFDIFGSLARWTSETFHFTAAVSQEAEVSPYYEPLRQVLRDNDIPGALAPQWYPEGFVAAEPEVEKSKRSTTVSTKFQGRDEKEFWVSITWNPNSEPPVYEKDNTSVETYTRGEKSFYIFVNAKNATWAVWSDGGFLESICGDLSVDQVKKIIDSIGG